MSARRTGLVLGVLAAATAAVVPGGAAGRAARGRADGAAPVVQSMIVGVGGRVLSPARGVLASRVSVLVGHRRCPVAGGTPLAVLAAARRAGGPGYAVRDYGRCGGSPANSGQLFVFSLGGETNHAQSGWEYKVDGLAGSAGAADPNGPSGDGHRLRAGDEVLWFWCVAAAGGCQRTLQLTPDATSVAPGASLRVSVRGLDNEARAQPVAGAIVTLGSDFASTDAHGVATLSAPGAPGRYRLSATRAGLVPSFPDAVTVG